MTRVFAAGLCFASLACLGCGSGGPDLGEVSGVVTMDGKPLANVAVTFTPAAGGRSSTGMTDDSGKYTLGYGEHLGAVVGKHQVRVTTPASASGGADPEMSSDSAAYEQQASGGSQSDYNNATVREPIPEKYNTATTLEFEVTGGSQTINLELTSK